MSVYLDIAFLINFLFDAELIFLTLTFTSKKIVYPRLILAALLGGLEGVFVFFPYFRILSLPPISLLISLLMVFVALKPASKKELLEGYIFFVISAFLLGGAVTLLNLKTLFGLLLILPLYFVVLSIKRRIYRKETSVTLCYKDKKLEKRAVYDSGNGVFYLDKPVIFGDRRLFCEILDAELSQNDVTELINAEDLCLVPYKSMGKSGVAAGIRLENAVVSEKSFEGAVVCLFDGDLDNKVILNGIMV